VKPCARQRHIVRESPRRGDPPGSGCEEGLFAKRTHNVCCLIAGKARPTHRRAGTSTVKVGRSLMTSGERSRTKLAGGPSGLALFRTGTWRLSPAFAFSGTKSEQKEERGQASLHSVAAVEDRCCLGGHALLARWSIAVAKRRTQGTACHATSEQSHRCPIPEQAEGVGTRLVVSWLKRRRVGR
jgi:hypothetical protein